LALAKLQSKPVLLVDLDLSSGLVGFMLSLNNPQYSIVDAAENALDLDENLWEKIVSGKENLDVLPVGKLSPGFRIEAAQVRHTLSFARRQYSTICVDLSGMMERYSVEVLLHEARQVFLVATSELPVLHLAREKLAFLRSQDLGKAMSLSF
jgi:Flp pilus assembly CpaE family ATPase